MVLVGGRTPWSLGLRLGWLAPDAVLQTGCHVCQQVEKWDRNDLYQFDVSHAEVSEARRCDWDRWYSLAVGPPGVPVSNRIGRDHPRNIVTLVKARRVWA
jgi:hypothetical protein